MNGQLDLQKLGLAMRYLLLQNPLLACELRIERGVPRWRHRPERARQAAPQLISTLMPEELMNDYPGTLVAGKGHTFEVRVFRNDQRDALGITVDHTAADAAGCLEIVAQLGRLYTQMQDGERFVIGEAHKRPRSLDSVRAQLGRMQCLLSMANPGVFRARWQFPAGTTGTVRKPVYLFRHFDARCRGGLRAMSRMHNATVNDLLLAAMFRALLETLPAGQARHLPVQFTADLRRYLPARQRGRIANLSGSGCVWLDAHRAGSFKTLAEQTHRAMQRAKERRAGTGSSFWLELLFAINLKGAGRILQRAFDASRSSGRANPLLTNFGMIDESRLTFGSLKPQHACITAPNLLAPGLVVGASSFRDRLTLSTGFDANTADPQWVGRVLDRMISSLESAE